MAQKRWLTEDKLALIMGLFLFLLGTRRPGLEREDQRLG